MDLIDTYIKYLYDIYHKIIIKGSIPVGINIYKSIIGDIVYKPNKSDDIFMVNFNNKYHKEEIEYFFQKYVITSSSSRIIFNNGTRLRFRTYDNIDINQYKTSLIIIIGFDRDLCIEYDILDVLNKHNNIVMLYSNLLYSKSKYNFYTENINYSDYIENPNIIRNKLLKIKINKIKNNIDETRIF